MDDLAQRIEELENMVENQTFQPINWTLIGKKALYVLLILVVGLFAIRIIRKLVREFLKRTKIRKSVTHYLLTGLSGLMYFILAIFMASALGLETTSLVAIVGSLGLAIGLALQGSLSDLASGILILALQPLRTGDYVYVKDEEGELLIVHEIRLFQTVFKNILDHTVILPNSKIIKGEIVNLSKEDAVKLEVGFDVSYSSDTDEVREIVLKSMEKAKNILQDRPKMVAVSKLADSGVHMIARAYVKDEHFLPTKLFLLEQIKEDLTEAGIEIPFPQMEVRMLEN